jgi:hypothetical protein
MRESSKPPAPTQIAAAGAIIAASKPVTKPAITAGTADQYFLRLPIHPGEPRTHGFKVGSLVIDVHRLTSLASR